MTHTIVFADNEPGILRYCKQELEAAGYRVLLARDGEEAVDLINTSSVDLVILDEHMPRCCGLEAAKRLKQWRPNLPVILFTADAYYERFHSPLVDAVVVKSEDLTALRPAVTELLYAPLSTDINASTICGAETTSARRAVKKWITQLYFWSLRLFFSRPPRSWRCGSTGSTVGVGRGC